MSTNTKSNLFRYVSTVKVLDCPNLTKSFERGKDWRDHDTYGIALGYHYLGGHSKVRAYRGSQMWDADGCFGWW